MDDLTIDHGGLALFEGVATVVAAAVAAISRRERRPVAEMAAELLVPDADYAPAEVATAPQGRNFGYAETPAPDAALDRILTLFRTWLIEQEDIMAPSVSDEVETLRGVAVLGATAGASITDPDDIGTVVDMLVGMGSDGEEDSHESMMACLFTLDEAMPEDDTAEFAKAVVDAMEIAPDARLRTLRAARVCTAIPEFLEWLGARRPVTQSGYLRLADIEPAAAILGVSARGVRKLPEWEPPLKALAPETPLPDPQTFLARSMRDVPMLEAWWEAMLHSGILTVNTTSARPGPATATWSGGTPPDLETVEDFVSVFTAMILTHGADRPEPLGTETVIPVLASPRALVASAPGLELPLDGDVFNTLLTPRALQRLAWLQRAGLMERDAEGRFHVPEGARRAVATTAMSVLKASSAEDDE